MIMTLSSILRAAPGLFVMLPMVRSASPVSPQWTGWKFQLSTDKNNMVFNRMESRPSGIALSSPEKKQFGGLLAHVCCSIQEWWVEYSPGKYKRRAKVDLSEDTYVDLNPRCLKAGTNDNWLLPGLG